MAGRWLQSLLVLWLLLGVSVPAWAACSSPQTATIPSGGSVVFGCADTLGFDNPAITPPSHGSLDWGDSDSVYNLTYTNNGDGATFDTFVAQDEDTLDIITFNITVEAATSLVVSPAVLPTPTIGVAYSVQMSTTGGDAPYSYSLGAGGEFPPGLSLSTSGLVSGTPTQSGTHSFTVNVSDASAVTASKSYSVDIPAPALDMSPDNAVTGTETVAYNLVFSGSGGTSPYVFTVDGGLGPLPPGLSLGTSGAITGTPTAGTAGSYPVRIVMADNTTKSTSADTHSMAQDFTFVIEPPPTIAVGPTTLTGATAGAAYNQALSASGGTAPYSFAVTSGSLPAGLDLAADGALTGTPTAGGNFNFTITATDSNGFSGDRAYNPTVAAADIVLSSGLASTDVGVTYAGAITASGGTAPYSYAVTNGVLPAGLTLDAATGVITGTATAGGIFDFTVAATDSSGGTGPYSDSRDYQLVVYSPTMTLTPSTLPDGLVNAAYSQTFETSGGTAPYSYTVTSGTLPPGLSLTTGGVLSGTPTAAGTFNFTFYVTDSSTGGGPYSIPGVYEVTIDSAAPIANPVSATVAYGSGANPITLDLTGGAADSVAVATAPGHGTAIASGTAITYQPAAGYAGADSFTYTATNADGTSVPATVSVTVSAPVIVITPSAPLTAQVGTAYSQTFTWSGGAAPYSGYSVTGLPAGLTVTTNDADSVTVSGTPTQGGSFTVSASASDSSSGSGPFTTGDDFTLQVDAPSLSMTPVDGTTLRATYPQPYSQVFSASGGVAPYSYSLTGTLPAGMSFDGTTGTLSGTPTEAGPGFTLTVTATDSSTGTGAPYSVSQDYDLEVDQLIDLTPLSLADGTVGASYTQTLGASGGVAPYTFAMNIGTSLPPGLSLAADGSISGTPTTSGTYNFNIRAADANGVWGSHGYIVTVAPATLVVTPAALPGGAVNTPYSQTIGASGGIAPYSYAVVAGALPPGFNLDAGTGVLSGSTDTAGSYSFDVEVRDSSGGTPATGTASYTIAIDTPTITLAPVTLPDGTVRSAYSQSFTASGGTAPYAFAVSSGALPAGMSLAADGTLSGTPTGAGDFTFAVTATDSSTGSGPYSGTGNYTLTIADVAPTANDVSATVAYGSDPTPVALDISGSAATSVAVASAPTHGVASASGLSISYQPEAGYAGTDSFTYIARNAAGDSAPATVSITVGAPTLALTPAAGTLAPGYGASYSQVFSASGGAAPYTYALSGTLPAGLVFDTASGTLSGTASETGSFAITVTATDSSTGAAAPFSVAANYDVEVASATIAITPATLADGTAGSAYNQALAASGGVAPYTFELATGTLPAGLQLGTDGTLSGTPTASGTFAITLQATDAHGQAGSGSYSLQIAAANLTLSPATVEDGVVGTAYRQSFSAGGGVAPYHYEIAGGVLPAGLELDASTGELAGTPTTAGSHDFQLRATDNSSGTAATVVTGYTLVIAEAPPVAVDDAASTLAGQAVTIAVTDNDSGVIDAIAVDTAPGHGSVSVDGLAAVYTPAAGFFGSDSFRYIASGPGGSSAAATVTIEVAPLPVPVAKPQSLTTLAGETVQFEAATDATGGPFTGVAIVEAPAEGEVVVDGTRIGYTPLATADGMVEIRYTLANAYGASEPVTATITVNPRPIAATHQANTLSGGKVSVELTDNARGGPFTGAELLSVSPAEAGDASITATGEGDSAGYRLDFSAAADYAGTATVRYTLSNAYATSAAATVSIEVEARPDPTRDAEVTGLLRAQVASVRRLARGQLGNFQQRMEQLHGGREATAGFDNGLSVAINRQCDEREWQIVGSTCPRPLHDERAPVIEPVTTIRTDAPVPEFGIWTAGAMSFGDYDARRGASGFEFETQGISFGVDRHFSPTLALGAGLGYGRDVSDVGDNGSRSEADAWSAAVYASYHPGEHVYLDALLGRQWLSLQLRRHVTANGAQVQGERDGHQWLASLTGGYQWQRDQLGMTTYARVDVARAQLDGYVEQGDPVQALAFEAQDVDSTTTSLGWRMDYRREFDWGSFTPQFRVEYQHDLDADSVATMRYADLLDGPFYRTDVDGFDRNRFVLGLGAGWFTDRQLGLRLEYRSVLGDSGVDDQSLLLQVEKQY